MKRYTLDAHFAIWALWPWPWWYQLVIDKKSCKLSYQSKTPKKLHPRHEFCLRVHCNLYVIDLTLEQSSDTHLGRGQQLCEVSHHLNLTVRGVFGKYVEKCYRMHIKYTRRMKFCINEYELLNIKYYQYEKGTPINDLDMCHWIG